MIVTDNVKILRSRSKHYKLFLLLIRKVIYKLEVMFEKDFVAQPDSLRNKKLGTVLQIV
jgi:hypothetical protein